MRLRGLSLLLSTFLTAACWAQVSTPPQFPDMAIHKRDYSGNVAASDSNWYWKNADGTARAAGGGTAPAVEYDYHRSYGNASGVVYVRGTTSTTIQVTFHNWANRARSGTLTFQGARLAVPNAGGTGVDYVSLTVSPTTATPISLPAGTEPNPGSQTVSVTVSGLPQSVSLGDLELKYDMPLMENDGESVGYANNGTNGGFVKWDRLYVVDAAPVGLQAAPWTDFLEYACRWAFGAVGQADMRQKMTYGMRDNSRIAPRYIKYDGSEIKFIQVLGQEPELDRKTKLNLNKFISEANASNGFFFSVQMHCQDYAAILLLAFQSQGSTGTTVGHYAAVRQTAESNPQYIYFQTNKLRAAGYEDTDESTYQSITFGFHVVVVADNGKRFDSSNSYLINLSGNTHKRPADGWTLPGYFNFPDWPYNGLIFGPPGHSFGSVSYYGPVFREHTPIQLYRNTP